MAKYLVRYQGYVDAGVWVNVDDPDDAWDASYENLPMLCAHCTGYGRNGWFMELGDGWESYEIENEDGDVVASENTVEGRLRDEVMDLREEVQALRADNHRLEQELGDAIRGGNYGY